MPEQAPILAAATPEAWLRVAAVRWREILLDHAYCEKKAASSALALIFAYPEDESQNLELSRLAREGSGSAARSIYGGLVRMHAGARADGDDAIATPVAATPAFVADLRMIIAEVGGGAPKTHGSRDAMEHCAATSPLYAAWGACVDGDLRAAEAAIAAGDLAALGAVTEGSALAMHAAAIASRPTVLYWQPATLAALAAVRALRADGVGAWATMDAGPHVKVLTSAAASAAVATAMAAVPGVTAVTTAAAGPGVERA